MDTQRNLLWKYVDPVKNKTPWISIDLEWRIIWYLQLQCTLANWICIDDTIVPWFVGCSRISDMAVIRFGMRLQHLWCYSAPFAQSFQFSWHILDQSDLGTRSASAWMRMKMQPFGIQLDDIQLQLRLELEQYLHWNKLLINKKLAVGWNWFNLKVSG